VLEGGPGSAALARDPAVSDTLVAALTAPEPGVREMAASLLAQGTMERAGPALIRVVDDDLDPSVRATALDALATLGGPPTASAAAMACLLDDDAGVRAAALRTVGAVGADDPTIDTHPWIEALADDPSPAVRGALAGLYWAYGPDPRSVKIILDLLAAPSNGERLVGLETDRRLGGTVPAERVSGLVDDPSPPIRAAALASLAARDDADGVIVGYLVRALDDDADEVRSAAARALSERESTPSGLLDVLADGSNRAQEAALTALRGHGPDVRQAVIAWTLDRLGRATELRRARIALAVQDPVDPPAEPALGFLLDILARREARTVGLALRALVVLGVPEAGGVIRRCLHSDDPEIRARAIEALDSIGDRELPSALVRLLEDEAIDVRDRDAVLARLSDDDDPWINGLARRVRGGEDAMPDTSRTLGDLDAMLFLRRVPLFDGLEPEDLQRIATTSVEHVYPAGEALVREGDVGDELIVIVEGSVRVVHVDADGTERLIRRYGSGDHIGELAVLREAPRAATVIAEGDGVRGLVIGGAGLKSILRERPDAAMAMLAVLAERISRQ
jgi:HEAT repeat protein